MADSEIVQRILMLSEGSQTGADLLETVDLARGRLTKVPDDLNEVNLGRLDWSPRKNWVEEEGGLPAYIEKVAIGIMKGTGKTREQAIPIAISRIKVWATGKGVNADTQARAVAALAEWQKMRASAKARPNKGKK